jgi:exopolyphosphatase/guanosine-5'-triphosphate,3'-diphosphate pyrophosphatase
MSNDQTSKRMRRLAAIDIGTVSTRLLVADVSGAHVSPLCERTEITHLGEGVSNTGHLSSEALARVKVALESFCAEMSRIENDANSGARAVERTIAVATSAARDADNSDELEHMLDELGIELAVIAGTREAELSFLGAASAFPVERLLLADIGGGSTELVFGDARLDASDDVLTTQVHRERSFNLGCRRLTEMFLDHDPPTAVEMKRVRMFVAEQVKPFISALPAVPSMLLVVGGTATTLAAIDQEMAVYDAGRVNGAVTTRETLSVLVGRLSSCPLFERRNIVGLQPARAGVIVAGALVLQELLEQCGLPSYTTGESDILEGILLDAARR